MSQVLTMKLTEVTSICRFSDRFGTAIKVNMKEMIMGNNVFLKNFPIYLVNGLQPKKKIPNT